MQKKSALVIAGLTYTFVINTLGGLFWVLSFPENRPDSEWQRPIWTIIGIFDLLVVLLAVLYLFNIFKSKITLGILATITNLLGGVLILIGKDSESNSFDTIPQGTIARDTLEYKLIEIENLLKKKIISQEEYQIKRSQLINK
jgi:hypothetical protein